MELVREAALLKIFPDEAVKTEKPQGPSCGFQALPLRFMHKQY